MKNESYINFYDNYFFKKMFPETNKNIFKKVTLFYFIQLILFCLVIYIAFFSYHNTQYMGKLAEEVEHIQLGPFILTRNFKMISDDIILIHDDEKVQAFISERDTRSLTELTDRFVFFSRSRSIYSSIGLIDEKGHEVINIGDTGNRASESSGIIDINKLKLNESELYISSWVFKENDLYEALPQYPFIRFAVPVSLRDEEKRMTVVLNYNANSVLEEYLDHFTSTEKKKYAIVRGDGAYISGFNQNGAFNDQKTFSEEFPDVWNQLSTKSQLQIHTAEGVFTVYSYNPIQQIQNYLLDGGSKLIIKEDEDPVNDRRVSFISRDLEDKGFYMKKYLTLPVFLICILIQIPLLIIMWITIRNGILRKVSVIWMESFFQGLDKNPASIVFTDQNGDIQYTNRKFQALTGYTPDEVFMKNPRILKSGAMSDEGYLELWQSISSGSSWSGEFHNKDKKGNLFWVFASISPIFNKKGKIIRYLGIQEDISERKKLMAKLEEKSSKDFLTGLLNRRAFFEQMDIELERSLRGDYDFTLLMIDIDFFKKVNDTYGHQRGDEVLIHLSENLRKSLRAADLCARFGGEEFIIVLPETDLLPGVKLAERLRMNIENSILKIGDISISYTLSIGVTDWRMSEDLEATIGRADKFLYIAKNEGRNRVISDLSEKES